ncbi:MAG: M48 family peptidase, partial [Hyphomicrobium sp.]
MSMVPSHVRSSSAAALKAGLAAALLMLFLPMASARAQGLPLIRDTEIERLLNDYSQSIFRAAGLGTGRVTVRIVNNEA